MTTLFAESGNFKTTFLGHMLLSMAQAGKRSLLVTLEDSAQLAAHRYLAKVSGLNYGEISGGTLSKEEVGKLSLPAQDPAELIWVMDDMEPNIDEIIRFARGAKTSKSGLDCLAIDYVQMLDGPGGEKNVLTEATKKLLRFAATTRTAVLLISQQKQETELDRDDPRPRLGDMFGSSAMRVNSKLVLGLFRPWMYQKEPALILRGGRESPYAMYAKLMSAWPDAAKLYPNMVEVHILKNVLGRGQAAMHVVVDPGTGRIKNADELMRTYLG